MVRFVRASQRLALGALLGASFAFAAPQAATADSWRHDHHRGGFWLPLPPPPPFFFPPPVVVRRPYYGPGYYDRYERYERRYDRHERHERRGDRYERRGRW